MARTVRPRFQKEGRTFLQLLDSPIYSKLDIPADLPRSDVREISALVESGLMLACKWWEIDTGRPLFIFESEIGHAWCLIDVLENQVNYRWLSRKAQIYEGKLITHIQKDIDARSA